LDKIVAPGAKLEKIAGGLERAEGPLWMRDGGYLLFSDFNSIKSWSPKRGVSMFRDRTFAGPAPEGTRVGTNGLTLDPEGRLLAGKPGDGRVVHFKKAEWVTIFADRYEDKRLNSPNDLVRRKNGDVYFTDPPYFDNVKLDDPDKLFVRELDFSGVYRATV